MGLPTNDLINRDSLQNTLERIGIAAANIRNEAVSLRDRAQAGPVTWLAIFDTSDAIAKENALADTLSQTPGLIQYVRDQFQDQAKDIRTDFIAMQTEVNQLLSFIVAQQSPPMDLDAGGEIRVLDTGPTNLTPLINRLSDVIATIDVS